MSRLILAKEIENFDRLLRDLKATGEIPRHRSNRKNYGKVKGWVLKNLSTKPIVIADFCRKGVAAKGFHHSSVYFCVIKLIDEGVICENRVRHLIWRREEEQ